MSDKCANCGTVKYFDDFARQWTCYTCDEREKKREIKTSAQIKTRCPSCGHDTLIIDDAGYLVCSLIGCEKPTMIGDAAAEIARLKADAAKDAECIAELAREIEDSFGVAETRKFGVDRVNGVWERVK